MRNELDNYIAAGKTSADWYAVRDKLIVGVPNGWYNAFAEFFSARLSLRYLHPIKILQENGTFQGEGFSIAAIQCSLIEFLESTTQGTNYRYLRRNEKAGEHEYSSSRDVFVSFLSNREPFAGTFDKESAQDFYVSVRCGLLHEARTKNGWKIWAQHPDGKIAIPSKYIVYRDNFQAALLIYIQEYGKQLPLRSDLQEAFIRKFNALCI